MKQKSDKSPKTALSYSKISCFNSCSWLAYAQYNLSIPRTENEGATVGNVVHEIIEVLAAPKRKPMVDQILLTKKWPRSVLRFAYLKLKKTDYYSKDNLKKIFRFAARFIRYDFHFQGAARILPAETKFDLKQKTFWLRGFIDAAAIFGEGEDSYIVIRDAKTQKENFSDEELESSIQSWSYLLAAKILFPEINIAKSRVEFIMLAHPTDFVKVVQDVDEDVLDGFKDMLAEYQLSLDALNEQTARKNFAAAKGYLPAGSPFGGMMKCGGNIKFAGQLKKDGNPRWYCPARYPFEYYVLKDSTGKVLTSSREEAELRPKEGQTVESVRYKGCPYFRNTYEG